METKWIYRKPPEECGDDYNPVIYWVDDAFGVPIADIKDNANPEENARLIAAAPMLLQALKELQKQIWTHHKMNVKKDFSLMVADAAASKAIFQAEGRD